MCKPHWFHLETDSIQVPSPDKVDGWEPKNTRERSLPLSKRLKKFLIDSNWLLDNRKYLPHLEAHDADWEYGPASKVYRWDPQQPSSNLFEDCSVKATTHNMRHSFASQALMGGKSIEQVALWLGDLPSTVAKTYAHFIPNAGELDDVFPGD